MSTHNMLAANSKKHYVQRMAKHINSQKPNTFVLRRCLLQFLDLWNTVALTL